MGFYQDQVVPLLTGWSMRNEKLAAYRQRVVPEATGRVLEIGIGSGLNLPLYLPKTVQQVIGLEPSRKLLEMAAAIHGTDLPDLKVSLDSLAVLEETMRHFYIKAMVEKSLGEKADWKAVDAAMIQAASLARESSRFDIQAVSRPSCRRIERARRTGRRSMNYWRGSSSS